MKRFGIIGHPVAGSLSPVLFSAAYDGRYPYDLLDDEDFEVVWARFLAGYDGINVTAPFKQDAFAQLEDVSDAARRCEAVNLVVKTPDGLKGYNTDVFGVLGAVGEGPRRTLVVGAGGAARAAVAAALMLGGEVTVAGRNAAKTAALSASMGCRGISLEEARGESPELMIYTLPGSAPVPEGLPFDGAQVLEAEYKHPQLESVPCREYIHGKHWLVHQALAGYALFTGEEPSAEKIWQAITF